MKLSQLLKNSNYVRTVVNFNDFEVKGISENSNLIKNYFIFAAIKGNQLNGEEFIYKIDKSKIVAVIISKNHKLKELNSFTYIYSNDVRKLYAELASVLYPNSISHKVSVTGTNGKTSVAYYTSQIWRKLNFNCGSVGTLGITYNKKKIFNSQLTTPSPEINHRYLSILSKKGCEKIIFEASSIGLEQKRLYPIKFDVVAFTNLSHDHLDYHKTFEKYKRSKLLLFNDYVKKKTVAVIYSDSEYSKYFMKFCHKNKIEILDYGKKAKFFKIGSVKSFSNHSVISVFYKTKHYEMKVFGNSYFEICNKICSLLIVFGKNLSSENFKHIEKLRNPDGRLEHIFKNNIVSVFVDYAHTPNALKNKTEGRLILVFGCGGERDKSKRPVMTRIALKFSDIVFITEDNSRFEDPNKIFKQMTTDLEKKDLKKIQIIQNREKAISEAIRITKEKDIVLIAGKGHENYQIIKGDIKYFSDKEVALKNLNKKKNVDRT